MSIITDIGDRILLARRRAGLTQAELAIVLKVTEKTVSNYERHQTEPSGNDLDAVLRFLEKYESGQAEEVKGTLRGGDESAEDEA